MFFLRWNCVGISSYSPWFEVRKGYGQDEGIGTNTGAGRRIRIAGANKSSKIKGSRSTIF